MSEELTASGSRHSRSFPARLFKRCRQRARTSRIVGQLAQRVVTGLDEQLHELRRHEPEAERRRLDDLGRTHVARLAIEIVAVQEEHVAFSGSQIDGSRRRGECAGSRNQMRSVPVLGPERRNTASTTNATPHARMSAASSKLLVRASMANTTPIAPA